MNTDINIEQTEIQCQTRKRTRLREYDYSKPGFYYVTICTHNRIELFGEIINGKMKLNIL